MKLCESCTELGKYNCPVLDKRQCPLNKLVVEASAYETELNERLGKAILKELDRQREIKQLDILWEASK